MTTTVGRSRSHSRPLTLGAAALLLVAALLAPAGAAAGYARSDPTVPSSLSSTDIAFLAVLDHYGITYPSPSAAIAGGHAICKLLDDGMKPYTVGLFVEKNSGLDMQHTAYLVGASIGAYCPEHESDIQD